VCPRAEDKIEMKTFRKMTVSTLVAVAFLLGVVGTADAQRRNDRDIRDAVRSLNSKIEDFELNLRYQMQSSSANVDQMADAQDNIRDLRDNVSRFQDNFDRRRDNRDDVTAIVEAARKIDLIVKASLASRRVTDDWAGVRKQIDRLGTNYGVVNAWETDEEGPQRAPLSFPVPTPVPMTATFSVGLSGTYDLDAARSENVNDIIADTTLGTTQRDDLREKLTAPQQIALDIRGRQVTLATSEAPPITITADGIDKTERTAAGKTIRLRATLRGETLTVTSLGGDTDYAITFTSVSGGRVMKVSRRITTDYMSQTVVSESVYNKTASIAHLGIKTGGRATDDPNGAYSDNDQTGSSTYGGLPTTTTAKPGNYVVPNGTLITGYLENEINTGVSQNNDRFKLTVQSPNEFRGAVVEGYISGVGSSGKVSGRSNITFNFEKITLRGGQSYDFAGNLQSIKNQDGKTVKIDNEGTAQGDSQTTQTAKRGGIGAGIGAIIGAIAGGAKGAVIGAVVGGGAGAGSVIVTGKDDLRLMPGSTINVTASAPANVGPR